MRTVLTTLTTIAALVVPFSLHGQTSHPRSPGYCIDSTQKGDSAFVVRQAIRAFGHSIGITDSLKVAEFQAEKRVTKFQAIRDGSQNDGVIVELEPTDPNVRGGGALLWVDGETFCAIVLRRYQ